MGPQFVTVVVHTSLFLSLASAQFGSNPFSGFSSSNLFSSGGSPNSIRVPGFSGSYPVNRVTYTQNMGDGSNPSLEFLNPQGLRINVPVPPGWSASPYVEVKVHIKINQPFMGEEKTGHYNTEDRGGSTWTFDLPEVYVRQADIIYWLVEVRETTSYSYKFFDYKGFYQVADANPHGGNSRPVTVPASNNGVLPVSSSGSVFEPLPSSVMGGIPNAGPPSNPGLQALMKPEINEIPPLKNQGGCQKSQTTFNNGMKPCQGEYFASDFQFIAEERLGNDDPEERFVMFSADNFVENSVASTFKVSPLGTKYDPQSVDGTINLPRCTASESRLCTDSAKGYLIMPPVIAARKTSKETLYFRYGELQITAKFPSGDWIVPELWLVPKYPASGDNSTRITVAMSRGNAQLRNDTHDLSSRVLEAGVQSPDGDQMFKMESQRPWSDDYHDYQLRWTPDEINFGVDDRNIGTVRIGEPTMANFNQEFYLVIGVHAGGNKDFPDPLPGKPWGNTDVKDRLLFWKGRNSWLPTWNQNSVLSVKKVTLRAL